MMKIAYIGPGDGPERLVLEGRPDVELVPFCGAEALPQGADAVVLAVPPAEWLTHVGSLAEREVPFYVSDAQLSADKDALESASFAAHAVESKGTITGAGSLLRYAINIVQTMQMVKQSGASWAAFLLHAESIAAAERDVVALCDLVRYICGDAEDVQESMLTAEVASATLATERVPVVQLTAVEGRAQGVATAFELCTGGRHVSWDSSEKLLGLDWSTRYNVPDRDDGFHLASVSAFLTAVKNATSSPVLSTFPDAVKSSRLASRFQREWDMHTGDPA